MGPLASASASWTSSHARHLGAAEAVEAEEGGGAATEIEDDDGDGGKLTGANRMLYSYNVGCFDGNNLHEDLMILYFYMLNL
jgi:hypothetical protein